MAQKTYMARKYKARSLGDDGEAMLFFSLGVERELL
jgi:hypothetical protein